MPDEKQPPEEPGDVISGFMGFGGIDIPPPPPEFWPEPPLPPDVVPIEGDSGDAPPEAPLPDGVVPIAGDGSEAPPSAPPDLHLGPRFAADDDDDDDDGDDSSILRSPWALAAIVLVAAAAVAVSFLIFTSGTKSPSPASAAAPATKTPAKPKAACPPPLALEHLQIGSMTSECVGPAQYKSDPRSKYYSYFAWELTYAGRQVQLVVTGGPLHMPVTSRVSADLAAVSSSGTKLADVDLYDNASGTKNFATSGTVRLNPSGAVTFEHVKLRFRGMPVVIDGHLAPD